jgi:succinyl-diaminopimelate desuccinylase
MREELINLTKKLVSINTDPKNKEELKEAINLVKQTLREFKYKSFLKNGYPSLLFYNKPASKFKIILNGHLDIIPGKKEQLQPVVRDDKLYGLGALDMKGGLATLILVFKEIAKKVNYPLALQVVTDEEIGGFYGTKYQIEKGVRADFVIAGEPTNFDIVHKAKGIIWLKVCFYGESAHGAYPWRGNNAILLVNKFINNLTTKIKNPKKDLWKTTFNLASIKTENDAFNKIPDYCEVWLDFRFIPEDKEKLLTKIKEILPKESKLEIIVNEPSLMVNKNNEWIIKLKRFVKKYIKNDFKIRGANGSSDCRHYGLINIPAVEFGPVGGGIGSDNEWVDIKSLNDYYKILEQFLKDI